MELIEAIKTRRSVRRFIDKSIDRKTVARLVETAMWAPTWKNSQTARFHVIDDRNLIKKIGMEAMPEFNMKNSETAPILVALSAVNKRSGYEKDGTPSTIFGDAYTHFDLGCVAQTFCLAAHDEGIGTVMIGIYDPIKVKEMLNVPENEDVLILIACGYHEGEVKAPLRKSVDDVLRFV